MSKKEFLQERLKGLEYVQPEKCAKCHKCCEAGGCAVLPMDIEPFTVENVMKEINLGKFSISVEVLTRDVIFLTLNARECDSNGIDIFKSHTRCSLLTQKGCGLDRVNRPAFALALVPGDPCKRMIDDDELLQMWSKEQEVMEQVLKICSGGKSSLRVLHEHFDRTAKEIYEMLLSKKTVKDFSNTCKAAVVFGESLYAKIIRIANSEETTNNIVAKLVKLEDDVQTAIKEPKVHEIAKALLRFEAYRMLEKPPIFASATEKIEACLRYNKMYV